MLAVVLAVWAVGFAPPYVCSHVFPLPCCLMVFWKIIAHDVPPDEHLPCHDVKVLDLGVCSMPGDGLPCVFAVIKGALAEDDDLNVNWGEVSEGCSSLMTCCQESQATSLTSYLSCDLCLVRFSICPLSLLLLVTPCYSSSPSDFRISY